MNLFKTRNDKTVYINTQAAIGESWTAFHIQPMKFIKATVTHHDTLTFLGIQDSVKTIGFQAHDDANQPINHPVNNLTIKISKNNGFVRTLNFSLFPDLSINIFGPENLREYNLVGLSVPLLGVQDFIWKEVHDFQPNDELHIYEYMSYSSSGKAEVHFSILRYLVRHNFADSTKYTIERIKKSNFLYPGGSSHSLTHDTITETILPNADFDKIPGDPIITFTSPQWGFTYSNQMLIQEPLTKLKPSEHHWIFYHHSVPCWYKIHISARIYDLKYYKGLGGPYFYCAYYGISERALHYYKKGNLTWGSPFVLTGVHNTPHKPEIKLFPNPAKDWLWISSHDATLPFMIEFYDAQGRIIKKELISNSNHQVGLRGFSGGMHFYRIYNDSGLMKTGKVVVE
ncbi:MAG: T9SS type A sorting domain-containing protein [Bacteroidales bacterium]|nr:T9SS type A sorting domain-containing protein [Bacteroidales bacterium]